MNDLTKYIKSPLNYTGNKIRTLDQIFPFFPKKDVKMLDLFCGGANVGINTDYKNVTFIDSSKNVIEILKYFYSNEFSITLKTIEKIISEFNLSNSYKNGYDHYSKKIMDLNKNNGLKEFNKIGYYRLRKHYNDVARNQREKSIYLYVLMLYAFNNDLRFNKNEEFNLPVGKTDFNSVNYRKLETFHSYLKGKNYKFINSDFRSGVTREHINNNQFIYMDPPYLITEAVYNKGSNWNLNTEIELLELIKQMIHNNKKIILSNIISKDNMINRPLSDFVLEYSDQIKVIDIDYHYRSSSYNKTNRNLNEREVIITNL